MKIPILILAAGASSRMGKPKQLLPWGNMTLLENAIKSAKQSKSEDIYVVLGANSLKIKKQIIDTQVTFIENASWKFGLGNSIASGIACITMKQSANAIIIMLADQPLIDSNYLDTMIKIFEENKNRIIATSYGDKLGVPALFDAFYFEELLRLNKDFGAKELIKKYKGQVSPVYPYEKAADIDTASDYKNMINKLK